MKIYNADCFNGVNELTNSLKTIEVLVYDIIGELQTFPTLSKDIWNVTMLVMRRYSEEVQRIQILDTTRVGGLDELKKA